MQEYYLSLVKPSFAPPAYLFGPVWTILYIIIFISFGYIAFKAYNKKVNKIIFLPLFINLLANFLYTPLMFSFKNTLLASVDILFVLFSILWLMKITYKRERYFFYSQIPYLLWVSFATVLQFSILYLNGF